MSCFWENVRSRSVCEKEIFENLSILPANINLAGAEIELISAEE